MRILHLTHQYLPDHIGGVELYTQTLSHHQQQDGHDVAVFTRQDAERPGLTQRNDVGVTVYLASAGALSPMRRFLATFGHATLHQLFAQALDEFAPDVVHVQHLMGLPVSVLELLQERRIPYVITLWDFWWICANANLLTNYDGTICEGPRAGCLNCARCASARVADESLTMWLASRAAYPVLWERLHRRNWLLRRAMAGAEALLAPMPFVRDWYAAHGAPTNRMRVVPMGTEHPPDPQSVRDAGRPAGVRFFYLGGIAATKGVHLIVEAFRQIAGDASLWIAGDLSADPAYAERLRTLADSRTRFLGRLERAQVWRTFAQVDVLLVPSQWYETFCFVAHEAFAAGVPVIASDLGVLRDAVAHERNGLLVPRRQPQGQVGEAENMRHWRAAMQRVVDEPALLARLRQGIQPPLTIEQHVAKVEQVYGKIRHRDIAS